MRNVGVSIQCYATDTKGSLPPLTNTALPLGPGFGSRPASWSIQLLPYLDQTALYERVQSARTAGEANQLGAINIEVFTCPSDHLEMAAGRLGLVVNAGSMTASRWNELDNTSHAVDAYDYSFDGTGAISAADHQVTFATGVFWRADATTPNTLRANLDDISHGDGASHTLMLSENLDTRPFNSSTQTGGWSSDATGDLAFAIKVAETGPGIVADNTMRDGFGVAGSAQQPLLPTALIPSQKGISRSSAINSLSKATMPGQSPRPRSAHSGMVSCIFCDGSGKWLTDRIDPSIYVKLVTHDGGRYGEAALSSLDF